MKSTRSLTLSLAAAVLIMLASATIAAAAAGEDTCAGVGASIGGTCTPLTNTTSGNNANTAFGADALFQNTTGTDNTATGVTTLVSNTTGIFNTATGAGALFSNSTGISNTATGGDALELNTTGIGNTATGSSALMINTTGDSNTATGTLTLDHNTTGGDNTAEGSAALVENTTGNFNVGIGANAGVNLTTGDNNIDISNEGVAAESNTIRIGTQGTQTATFIAGIFGNTLPKGSNALAVMIDSSGHLGVKGKGNPSSARYKRDIRNIGDASNGLLKLRPVSFRYKEDPTEALQYGLIAEEVERVYPELVTHGDDGKVEGVLYDMLPALLLNEVQKLTREAEGKNAQIAAQQQQIASLQRQLDTLKKKDDQIDALAERLNALEQQARRARPEHLASAMH